MSMPTSVNEFPAMTFMQVAQQEEAPDFEAPNDEKMDTSWYSFGIIAESSETVVGAAEAFDALFRNFRGTMGSVEVQSVVLNNISHLEERYGDKLRRRISMDYSITYV